MTDDDVVARLRASLQATAARTPIGPGRLDELTFAGAGRRSRSLVAAFSAAAAVAGVAGVAVVVANAPSSGHRQVGTAGQPGAGTSPVSDCAYENYYVTASDQQLAGLTYLLPSPPTGYHLYGAWGTIDRGLCADTVTWYVEYDKGQGDKGRLGDQDSIQLDVTPVNGRAPGAVASGGNLSIPSGAPTWTESPIGTAAEAKEAPSASASAVSVGGHQTAYFGSPDHGALDWVADGLQFRLSGPVDHGSPDQLLALANSLVAVAPDDPRITPPPGCDVPAGSVCKG